MDAAGALVKQAKATITPRTSSSATPQSSNTKYPPPNPTDTPSPGRWRHPNFDEITRRQKASTFDDSNVLRIIWNASLLIAFWLLRSFIQANPFTLSLSLSQPVQSYVRLSILIIAFIPLVNIGLALLPLYHGQDNIPDISLTPSQRALLGLDPNATPPPTQGTQYITPPRYPRSPTIRNGSSSSNRSHRSSAGSTPYSRRDRLSESPSYVSIGMESPFSPSASPLWQKTTFRSGRELGRTQSLGSPSRL
ncbi:MAG: hypothetical protein LQ341_007481, partial [Variospora aurantia]